MPRKKAPAITTDGLIGLLRGPEVEQLAVHAKLGAAVIKVLEANGYEVRRRRVTEKPADTSNGGVATTPGAAAAADL